MTAREPSAVEVIASALHTSACGCADWHPGDPEDPQYDEQAEAVVAAIRAMSPQQIEEEFSDPPADGERRIVVASFDISDEAHEAMFDRIADAAHELDEQVMCSTAGPWREVQP